MPVKSTKSMSFTEFVLLMACMMSMVALSIDAMLPALSAIGEDLAVQNINNTQLIITMIFFGMAMGTLIAGPLADRFGRKPIIFIGFVFFIIGALLSYFSQNFEHMLIARFIQGLGISGPRILTTTLVRDRFEGPRMAKVMSLIMTIFILVPIIAPFFGQWVISFSSWHNIFLAFVIIAAIVCSWFLLRQEETLAPEDQQAISLKQITTNAKTILSNSNSLTYMLASGLITGVFISFLSTSQQIFQQIYGVGENFVYYFAALAASVGLASLTNSRIVMRYGIKKICIYSMSATTLTSSAFLLYSLTFQGVPPLMPVMAYLCITFFCIGLLFGNLNAQAMQPLGHLAGIGASFVGAAGTFIALPIAIISGQYFNNTLYPLVIVVILGNALALALLLRHEMSIAR
ncbi:MAG: multidrug effflux MFS transporter [Sinobacterium sp.]|nr:multidrug effflux MFS transporter [Sinobacterium sp.]